MTVKGDDASVALCRMLVQHHHSIHGSELYLLFMKSEAQRGEVTWPRAPS